MHWTKDCKKSSGQIRKHFNLWQIPVSVVGHYGLADGDHCIVRVKAPGVRFSREVKLVSGCEFRLTAAEAIRLRKAIMKSKRAVVEFDLLVARSLASLTNELERGTSRATKMSAKSRRAKIKKSPRKPRTVEVVTTAFVRNPLVVAEVLERARGVCEECGDPAPFR